MYFKLLNPQTIIHHHFKNKLVGLFSVIEGRRPSNPALILKKATTISASMTAAAMTGPATRKEKAERTLPRAMGVGAEELQVDSSSVLGSHSLKIWSIWKWSDKCGTFARVFISILFWQKSLSFLSHANLATDSVLVKGLVIS